MGRPRSFEPEQVIVQAMDAFWSNGYGATSPAMLAEVTGVGKGSLYHSFGSKRQLFDQALALYDAAGVELAEQCLSRPGATKDRIREFIADMVDTDLARAVPRGCLAVNTAIELAPDDEDATRAVHRMQQHTIAAMAARIEQGRRDGDVRENTDPVAFAQFLMSIVTGLRVLARTFDRAALHRIIDTALAAL